MTLIQKEIDKRDKEPFVKHHISKYNNIFPIWVIIELFTFTTLSHFYKDLKVEDQKYIARTFYKTHNKTLRSWLRCATDLRNFCAHFGRLYFRIFTSIPDGIPELDKSNERSLFALTMVMKNLYADSVKWNKEIYAPMYSLIADYSESIQFLHIGFPADWKTALKKQ